MEKKKVEKAVPDEKFLVMARKITDQYIENQEYCRQFERTRGVLLQRAGIDPQSEKVEEFLQKKIPEKALYFMGEYLKCKAEKILLESALQTMDPEQKIVVLDLLIEHKRAEEIAEDLGKSIMTVYRRRDAAILRIAEELAVSSYFVEDVNQLMEWN